MKVIRHTLNIALCSALVAASGTTSGGASPRVDAASPVDAGRYLITVGACNDCHTPGWDTDQHVPESQWLVGTGVGWRGPWGTTYPSNLRLLVQDMSEEAWVQMLHTRTASPPMPWRNVNALSDADARAIYQFIRSLGPEGERMPLAVGPDREPSTPYLMMEPFGVVASPGAAATGD